MKNKNVVVIGGTPRVINQVKSLKKKDVEGKTVGEILDMSRASRLIHKELQKKNLDITEKLSTGSLMNSFVELPNVDWREKEFKKVRGAYEIAQDIELDYAKQSSNFSC